MRKVENHCYSWWRNFSKSGDCSNGRKRAGETQTRQNMTTGCSNPGWDPGYGDITNMSSSVIDVMVTCYQRSIDNF